MLSKEANVFRAEVEEREMFFASCDGGDPGSPQSPSIWLFGLEPGWSIDDERNEAKGEGISKEYLKQYSVELQLGWPFNRNAFKLLAALDGRQPSEYREFAFERRPFEHQSPGYFKGNIFPVAVNKLATWGSEAINGTGFKTKKEYQDWVREKRFPIISSWINQCRPRLFLCTGVSHRDDFSNVSNSSNIESVAFFVNGYRKKLYWSAQGIVPLVILPHLSGGRNGLNSDAAIQKAAEIIREKLG